MTSPGWLLRSVADVPPGDAWLGPHERAAQAALRIGKRRADWRLGRSTAKAAVAAWLKVSPDRVEILAADDGAPEARLDGVPAPVAVSLSHRAARAFAVVGDKGTSLGCDLELVEARSDAFLEDWLAPAERATLARAPHGRRDLVANLLWTAKEAAAKARREGLRLDVREAVSDPSGLGYLGPEWRALTVRWSEGAEAVGWWRAEAGWVMAVAGVAATGAPQLLNG